MESFGYCGFVAKWFMELIKETTFSINHFLSKVLITINMECTGTQTEYIRHSFGNKPLQLLLIPGCVKILILEVTVEIKRKVHY